MFQGSELASHSFHSSFSSQCLSQLSQSGPSSRAASLTIRGSHLDPALMCDAPWQPVIQGIVDVTSLGVFTARLGGALSNLI